MATKNPYKGITFYPKMDTWCIGAYANVNGKVYHLSMTRFVYGSSIDHPIENPEWERSEHMDDWLQEKEPNASSFWVAGFSFGAYIAIQIMMRRIEVNRFIAIGTPANMFDLSFIYPCPTNGLFIHSEKDIVAPFKEADKIIKKAIRTKDKEILLKTFKNTDHFFTNHEEDVLKVVDQYIKDELAKGVKNNISL